MNRDIVIHSSENLSDSNQVTIRQSQRIAFEEKIIENALNKLAPENRSSSDRFKIALPSVDELSQSIDPDFSLREEWLRRYQEFELDRGGKSRSYISSLNTTIRAWDKFCLSNQSYSHPISTHALSLWFESLSKSGKKITTIKSHKAMISYLYGTIFNCKADDNPAKDQFTVGAAIKSLVRENLESDAVTQKELQAKPFRHADLCSLRKITTVANAKYFRDLVFISLCYATMLRASEVRTLKKWQIENITESSYQITRVRSKTTDNPEPKTVEGDYAVILGDYLRRYCTELNDNEYVFAQLTHYAGFKNPGQPMSLKATVEIFSRADRRLNVEPNKTRLGQRERWTTHAARVGGLIDGFERGLSLNELMLLGDWRSEEMLQRYLRGVKTSQNVKIQDDFL